MKTSIIKNNRTLLLVAFAMGMSFFFQRCTKTETKTVTETLTQYIHDTITTTQIKEVIVPNIAVPCPAGFIVDTAFTNEKSHSNVNWKSKYFDFSETYLTGRFAEYEFVPNFSVPAGKLGGAHQAPTLKNGSYIPNQNLNFNPRFPQDAFFSVGPNVSGPPAYFHFESSNIANNYMKFYVLVSTICTSEPGRDNYEGCGQNYHGVTFTDSTKRVINPLCDTAWLVATSWTKDGDAYIAHCNMTYNRSIATGITDTVTAYNGTPITKVIDVRVTYNGQKDFFTSGTSGPGTLRTGFSASFNFKRSDFMDAAASKQYSGLAYGETRPSERANSVYALTHNKTFGAYSASVGDDVWVNAYMVFSKKHL